VWDLSVFIITRLFRTDSAPKAEIAQHVKNEIIADFRHLARRGPVCSLVVYEELAPSHDVLNEHRLHAPQRLLREDSIQHPPFLGMQSGVCPSESTLIEFVPGHHVIEMRPLDVGLVVEYVAIGLWRSEE
jgi:hypothetical protein